jgi:uncharacterized membrane protein
MTKKSYLGVTILVTIIVIGVLFLFFNNSSTNLRNRLSETTAKAVVL